MKLPINFVARLLLKRVVVPAVGKAVANGKISTNTVRNAVEEAVKDEANRQLVKRGAGLL